MRGYPADEHESFSGSLLRDIRRRRGMGVSEMARRTGLDRSNYYGIERHGGSPRMLLRIAKALDATEADVGALGAACAADASRRALARFHRARGGHR